LTWPSIASISPCGSWATPRCDPFAARRSIISRAASPARAARP
jgi:hypothetical protein